MVSVYAVPVDATVFCGLCRFDIPCWHLPNIPPWKRQKNAIPTAWNKLIIRSCFWLRWCSECTLEDSKRPNPNCSNYNAPTSFILPQLGAHGALKIIKQLSFQFVLSLTLHQIIPPLHPLSSPLAVSGAPGLRCPQHPRRRPRRGAAPGWRCGRRQPRGAVVSHLRRRRARRRQRLEGSTPWLSTAKPRLQWEKLQSLEWIPWVSSFPKLYGELAQWQPLSLLVSVKITKTTNWRNLPQQNFRKRENLFLRLTKLISTYLKHFQSLFHTLTVVGPIRPIQVANVQEFFSLKMSYDVLCCFTSMFYHRHAENVLSKVDIACGPAVMGHPKDTSDYQCMPLCSVALSPHVLSLAKYLSPWRMRRFTKSQSHLITTNPATAVCAWRMENHQTTFLPVCSFTHSASDHPSTPPPVVPTGRFRGPWPSLSAASTAAPAATSCSTAAVWPLPAAQCSGVQPQAPKGSETSTAGGLHPVALHRPTPAAAGETAICRVISFKIV